MKVAYTKVLPREITNKGKVIVHRNGLFIKSSIKEITDYEIRLENGAISLEDDFKFMKYERPSNIIDTYIWCYALLNEYDELICWLCDH